jgi:hypothetical protein
MVESTPIEGDGIVRNYMYAKWRTDKEAQEGYSRELVNTKLPEKYYDRVTEMPDFETKYDTFLKLF